MRPLLLFISPNSCLSLPGTCNKGHTTPCLFLSRPHGHTSIATKSKVKKICKKNTFSHVGLAEVCIDVGHQVRLNQVPCRLSGFSDLLFLRLRFYDMMTPSLGEEQKEVDPEY
jgi:hypothetical protein